ncbi:MAG: P-loop NTPase fold protein [Caldisericia bacterium]
MNQKNFQKLIDNFRERPLENRMWLEDRKDELQSLKNCTTNFSQTIIGISGERGCGKTSLFNLFDASNSMKIVLNIEEKDSKFQIVLDISQKLCEFLLKERMPREIKKYATHFYQFTQKQETYLNSREYGVDIGPKWQKQEGRTSTERFNITNIKNRLNNMLMLLAKHRKVALCIDEIDKESKRDVILILDSLRNVLRQPNIVTFLSLPPQIYSDFLRSSVKPMDDYNLENILVKIIPLLPLQDPEIGNIITKRIPDGYHYIIPQEVKKNLIEYADGNPRNAIVPVYNILGEKPPSHPDISLQDVKTAIKPFLETYINEFSLTENQKKSLGSIIWAGKDVLSRKFIYDTLHTNGLAKSTIADMIDGFIQKRIMEEKDDSIYVDRKIRLYFRLFQQI